MIEKMRPDPQKQAVDESISPLVRRDFAQLLSVQRQRRQQEETDKRQGGKAADGACDDLTELKSSIDMTAESCKRNGRN